MLLNLHAASTKAGFPTVASVESLELPPGTDLGARLAGDTYAAPPSSGPAPSALPEVAPPPSPTTVLQQQPLPGTLEMAASPPTDDPSTAAYAPPLFCRSNTTLQHVIRPTVYVKLP